MSLSVVHFAVRQEEQTTTLPALVAIDLGVKCFPQYALSVARIRKCPFSLDTAEEYTVVIATVKSQREVTKDSDVKQNSAVRVNSSTDII